MRYEVVDCSQVFLAISNKDNVVLQCQYFMEAQTNSVPESIDVSVCNVIGRGFNMTFPTFFEPLIDLYDCCLRYTLDERYVWSTCRITHS